MARINDDKVAEPLGRQRIALTLGALDFVGLKDFVTVAARLKQFLLCPFGSHLLALLLGDLAGALLFNPGKGAKTGLTHRKTNL